MAKSKLGDDGVHCSFELISGFEGAEPIRVVGVPTGNAMSDKRSRSGQGKTVLTRDAQARPDYCQLRVSETHVAPPSSGKRSVHASLHRTGNTRSGQISRSTC